MDEKEIPKDSFEADPRIRIVRKPEDELPEKEKDTPKEAESFEEQFEEEILPEETPSLSEHIPPESLAEEEKKLEKELMIPEPIAESLTEETVFEESPQEEIPDEAIPEEVLPEETPSEEVFPESIPKEPLPEEIMLQEATQPEEIPEEKVVKVEDTLERITTAQTLEATPQELGIPMRPQRGDVVTYFQVKEDEKGNLVQSQVLESQIGEKTKKRVFQKILSVVIVFLLFILFFTIAFGVYRFLK